MDHYLFLRCTLHFKVNLNINLNITLHWRHIASCPWVPSSQQPQMTTVPVCLRLQADGQGSLLIQLWEQPFHGIQPCVSQSERCQETSINWRGTRNITHTMGEVQCWNKSNLVSTHKHSSFRSIRAQYCIAVNSLIL